ncbi:MAG: hypothetical protein V4598_07450 [Bdellovibrionota bacterium]
MKKLIAISLISISFFANADVCQLNSGSFDSAVRINGLPGYFFKVHPDGKYISFIESGNKLIDLTNGSQTRLQGGVDPVWSPDGAILTHPGNNEEGMNLHHANSAIAASLAGAPDNSKPVTDPRLQGVYQSIGKSGDTYSAITDHEGVTLAQYKIEEGVITPSGESARLCGNLPNFNSDLPMLSRDSKYLSVYDSSSRSTKIYNVNGVNCELAVDLGFPTGKVSFNMDSSQITFHIDQFGEFDDGWFSGISKDKVKNVVAMKLTRDGNRLIPGDWSLVSKAVAIGDGGYYPDYDAAGNIHYLEDRANFFQFVKVRQNQLEWFPFDANILKRSGDCVDCNKAQERNGLDVLATLWTNVCEASGIDMKLSPVSAASIDPAGCIALVNEFWTPALEITKERLLASCPRLGSQQGNIVGEWDLNRQRNGEELFNSRCLMCHGSQMNANVERRYQVQTGPETYTTGEAYRIRDLLPPFDLETNDGRTLRRMQNAIGSGSMPRGSVFTPDERSMVTEFLERKMVDHGNDDDSEMWEGSIRRFTPENLAKEVQTQLEANPTATPSQKETITRAVNCMYGNINCDAYMVEYAASLPAENKEEKIMRMKCDVMSGVTPQQCHDWYIEQNDDEDE